MENYRVNTNYAKSLFLLANDTNKLDTVFEDMKLVHKTCTENHILTVIFANPTIKESKKIGIATELFTNKVDKLTLTFINFVIRKRRAINLKGIATLYMNIYRKAKNIVLSELRTAIDVDEETKILISRIIGEYTNQTVELNAITDNRMLGGFCMSFDNNLYDARLRRKLAKLRNEFSKNIYEKGI